MRIVTHILQSQWMENQGEIILNFKNVKTTNTKKVQVNTPSCIWIWLCSVSLIFVTDNLLDWMNVSNCLQMHARETCANDHLRIATTVLRSHLGFLLHKIPLNNDHLSTTATIFGSQGWLLYTGSTIHWLTLKLDFATQI